MEKKQNSYRKVLQRKENIAGYLFILPNLAGFFVFTLVAVVFSFYMSFTDWSLIKKFADTNFIGLKNYIRLFQDKWFIASLLNNLWFLLVIPVQMFLALLVAVVLNSRIYFRNFIRTAFYLPNITNIVAISVVWFTLFNPRTGPINNFLRAIGIENPPGWLMDVSWAKPSLGIIMVWITVGYYALLYLAALQAIPRQLYEASSIDGAGRIRQFFKITIPMVSPTTFMILIISVMNSFKSWSLIQVMTEGGPGTSTYTLGYYIYYSAFKRQKIGYSSAVAWVLMAIVMAFSIIKWKQEENKRI